MTFAFIILGAGALLLMSAYKNQSLAEVITGAAAPDQPSSFMEDAAGQQALASFFNDTSSASAGGRIGGELSGTGSMLADGGAAQVPSGGAWHGSQAVVEQAIAIGKANGLGITSTKRQTMLTASGFPSDHWVGSKNAYAADQSNGQHPTPEMDKTAQEIADHFGMPWSGSGKSEIHWHGYRLQLIYRSMIGGNHYNHVHFGAKWVG